VPQIEVAFDIDANGILHVSAKDLATGKEQKIQITASSGLSKDEIQRMQRDAEQHAEEDQRKRGEIEARNEADSAVYRSEKMLRENAGKISDADKRQIEDAIAAIKNALQSGDADTMRSAAQRLNDAWQGVSANLYRAASEQQARAGQAQPGQAPPPGAEQPGGRPLKEEEVVDAEVVDEEQRRAA